MNRYRMGVSCAILYATPHTLSKHTTLQRKLAFAVKDLLQQTWGTVRKRPGWLVPRDVVRSIWTLAPYFRGYGQHDTQVSKGVQLDR